VLKLVGDGTGDLRAQAALLDQTVRALQADGAPTVDVVGYSAGGVVARLWATDLGGASVARRIVMLGTPNHGTEIAGLGAFIGGGACPEACRQLAPDSDLLAGLNDVGLPAGPQWVSVWTEQDEVVTPPDSAQVDGAVDLPVQQVCSAAQVAHGRLPTDPTVQRFVIDALGIPQFVVPTTCPA
jgi:pimeloyl-ACP methyl ester carboxylesterase